MILNHAYMGIDAPQNLDRKWIGGGREGACVLCTAIISMLGCDTPFWPPSSMKVTDIYIYMYTNNWVHICMKPFLCICEVFLFVTFSLL